MLRFAPSPTKDLNIAALRVAIFNYMVSKKIGEELIIRIEDIDKENLIEGKDKEILELLSLFSIEYASVVYQSENLKYHQKLAMQLMSQKKAFACFCSEEKLEELKQELAKEKKPFSYDGFCQTLSDETVLNCNAPFTVRLAKPEDDISFNDLVKGKLTFKPSEVDYFRILNHEKMPTYNYACAIDDMLYDISLIIREDKFLADTPRQIFLRDSLDYDKKIKYAHLPDVLNGNISVKSLIDEGFLPSAIANYLVLLGSNAPKEIFTLEEALEWFDIENISTDAVTFDIEKLKEINKVHLQDIDEMRFSKILGFADADIGKLGKLFLSDVNTVNEVKENIDSIFAEKVILKGFEDNFENLKNCIKTAPFFNDLEELKAYIIDKTNLNKDELEKPLRYILTGKESGPAISDIYPLIKNYLGEIVK